MRSLFSVFKALHFRKNTSEQTWQSIFCLFLRLALAATFLSSIADRFGLWGPLGTANVSWGSFTQYTAFASTLLSFLPAAAVEMLGSLATVVELILVMLLLLGLFTRFAGIIAGLLLLIYGLVITAYFGIKLPLNMSTFIASAAAFLLATVGSGRWGLDEISSK